jgi:hypothetical protein
MRPRRHLPPEADKDNRGDAPLDPAIIALAELLGEQLAAEEIARRARQAAAEEAAGN